MPRGIPNVKKEAPALEASGAVKSPEIVRSRDELDPEAYTKEFLQRNRPNVGGFEQKLAYYGEHPGWVRKWAIDSANRIPSLLENGWRFVLRAEVGMSQSVGRGNTDIGDRVSITTTIGDGPVLQYLMETTQELYDMQLDAALEPVRRSEAAMKAGAFAVNDTSNVYQPDWAKNRIETKMQ